MIIQLLSYTLKWTLWTQLVMPLWVQLQQRWCRYHWANCLCWWLLMKIWSTYCIQMCIWIWQGVHIWWRERRAESRCVQDVACILLWNVNKPMVLCCNVVIIWKLNDYRLTKFLYRAESGVVIAQMVRFSRIDDLCTCLKCSTECCGIGRRSDQVTISHCGIGFCAPSLGMVWIPGIFEVVAVHHKVPQETAIVVCSQVIPEGGCITNDRVDISALSLSGHSSSMIVHFAVCVFVVLVCIW